SPVIARHGQAAFQQIGIGLQTNVVHAEKHGREGAEPDGDHHPLQINPVSHVRGRSRYLARGIKNGVHCLVEGVPLFMFSTREEMGLDLIQELSHPHRLALQLNTDRKSTRLNSSHVKISYAVFCLKKKKKQII